MRSVLVVAWVPLVLWAHGVSQEQMVRKDLQEPRVPKELKAFKVLKVSRVLKVPRVLLVNKDHLDLRVPLENGDQEVMSVLLDRRALLVLVDCQEAGVLLVLRVHLDP